MNSSAIYAVPLNHGTELGYQIFRQILGVGGVRYDEIVMQHTTPGGFIIRRLRMIEHGGLPSPFDYPLINELRLPFQVKQ